MPHHFTYLHIQPFRQGARTFHTPPRLHLCDIFKKKQKQSGEKLCHKLIFTCISFNLYWRTASEPPSVVTRLQTTITFGSIGNIIVAYLTDKCVCSSQMDVGLGAAEAIRKVHGMNYTVGTSPDVLCKCPCCFWLDRLQPYLNTHQHGHPGESIFQKIYPDISISAFSLCRRQLWFLQGLGSHERNPFRLHLWAQRQREFRLQAPWGSDPAYVWGGLRRCSAHNYIRPRQTLHCEHDNQPNSCCYNWLCNHCCCLNHLDPPAGNVHHWQRHAIKRQNELFLNVTFLMLNLIRAGEYIRKWRGEKKQYLLFYCLLFFSTSRRVIHVWYEQIPDVCTTIFLLNHVRQKSFCCRTPERVEALSFQTGEGQEELLLGRKMVPLCPRPTWERWKNNITTRKDPQGDLQHRLTCAPSFFSGSRFSGSADCSRSSSPRMKMVT